MVKRHEIIGQYDEVERRVLTRIEYWESLLERSRKAAREHPEIAVVHPTFAHSVRIGSFLKHFAQKMRLTYGKGM